jgi:hypothetical protein
MACSNKRSSSEGRAGAGLGALRGAIARAGTGAAAGFGAGLGGNVGAGWAFARSDAFSSRNGVLPKPGGGFFATGQ